MKFLGHMKVAGKYKRVAFMALAMGSLAACSHSPTVQEIPETANPNEEVSHFEADLTHATRDQVNVLSPRNFKSAQESLQDAKSALDHRKAPKDILHKVAEGRAYLNQAQDFAKISHENMQDVLVARKQAFDAGAPAAYPGELSKADESLREVTRDVEKNDLKSLKEMRPQLQASYLDLELNSIKRTSLNPAKEVLTQAKKENATEYAPRTYVVAEKSIRDTDAYINANRHEMKKIELLSSDALAKAQHTLKITRESKTAHRTSSEEVALRLEQEQQNVAAHEGMVQEKNQELTALTEKNQELNAEQRLNQKFETARTQFTEDEADVYKQGNTLLIRLKKLNFPSGKAVLKGPDFALLAKVESVIKGFGHGSVTVEGHTDSKGGKKFNEQLSSERADAIKEYLHSRSDLGNLDIKAVGYGYQKPLASNKSAEGRAQNRRVDILINPVPGKKVDSDPVAKM